MHQLVDFHTKQPVTPEDLVFTGKESPWEVVMNLVAIKTKLNLEYFKISPPCLSKYLPLMPIQKTSEFISLRENATPLIKSKSLGFKLGLDLYFKVEGKNPTGSFKDRGSAVDISVAHENNAPAIILASTGNMAASCACYAAAAKIPCFVLVPDGVPVAKLAQVIAYGGRIVQIKGDYNDAAKMAHSLAIKMGFYLAGDYAYRVEGQKTAAFEILDQLFFQTPDAVIVPMGCGTNITAYQKGFGEYRSLGLIDRIPKLIGVEAAGAAAIVNSYNYQAHHIEPLESANTIASAIAVSNPIDGVKALEAIYDSKGIAVAVTDEEIMQAQYLLSTEEGLFVESASAASFAALIKLKQQDDPIAKGKIVCILTGDGLKDTNVVLKAAIKPVTIYPDEKEFENLYLNDFFKNKSMIFVDKNQVLFDTLPTIEQIKYQLESLLDAHYSDKHLNKIQAILGKILQKGKAITISDLQDSIQESLEVPIKKGQKIFSVVNFEVNTAKNRPANASVTVNIAGETQTATAEGVGPVDAVISALIKTSPHTITFKLTEYKVEIRSQGVNAVVYVELKLIKDHLPSLGRGTSPDIIQASIEAFEEAYNGFTD